VRAVIAHPFLHMRAMCVYDEDSAMAMAAPVGSVWLSEEQRYRTDEEQTEGQMPENSL